MRLIDADKLKRKVQRIATEVWMMKLTASVETTLNQFIDYLNEAPTIEIPQWIPCSERPPEKEGDYIVTLHHKWPDKEYKTVEVEEFRSGGFDENLYVKVVAWMPKPKPWEGAVNDSDNI